MSWNYRIATYMYSYQEHFPNDPGWEHTPDERIFTIISAYYDKESDVPHSYGEFKQSNPLDGHDSAEDLFAKLGMMRDSYEKTIIDLDNWPDEWNDVKME